MHYYLEALRKYAVFGGRSRRSEYWFFTLFNIIISIGLAFIESLIGLVGVLGGLYSLGVLVPSIAVSIRRLHDIGKSGWWLLIGLIPFIGFIVLIVFAATDSQPGDNQFGPNPKGVTA